MTIYTFEITSTTEILQHNPAGMTGSSEGKLESKKIPSPEEEAKAGRYLTEDGKHFRIPAQAFKSSFVNGGVGRRIGKRAATSVLKATIFPAEEWCLLLDPKTKKPLRADQYTIDTRRVVLKLRGGILRSRPKIASWFCLVAFEVDDIIGKVELLEEIGNMAGSMVGVGDFRPEKGGPFGRYKVKLAS
jgi:hypothetical protein